MPTAAQPLSVPVHANQLGAVEEVCAASIGCAQGDLLGQLLVLLATGVLAIVVIAVAAHVREARAVVSEEQSRTAAEQRAFARFARKVASFEAGGGTVQPGPAAGAVSATSASLVPSQQGIESVRTAYRETVLAMDHYEEEYDEPLDEHMRRELGVEIATAVEQSQQLSPPLKRALVERAREAARDRERLMTRLDHEMEALDAAEEELTSVADTVEEAASRPVDGLRYDELTDEWNRLGELKSRLSRLVARRQEALQEDVDDGPRTEYPSLNAYLYDDLDATFPILEDAAALAGRVKDVRRRVLLALTRQA
ncbi:MAG: hypothetical protein ABEJ92_05150 [Halobacteriales archaeon]